MAKRERRLSSNVSGDFYVDGSCIDCGACQWLAPENFDDEGGMARVFHQPSNQEQTERSLISLVSCPVSAIGTQKKHDIQSVAGLLPERIDGPVHYCGYHSEKSFGAASYLIVRPKGNILIDSPRFSKPLIDRLEALGGVTDMILTHADDVGDHEMFHRHFGCRRILHLADACRETRNIEIFISGDQPIMMDEEIVLLPVPGHTPGSICLLFRDTYLFSGDHLSWSPITKTLRASRRTCWYDWDRQIRSMERLLTFRFQWVLPGHGWRINYSAAEMQKELESCLKTMKSA